MKNAILLSAAVVALGLGASTLPASALPVQTHVVAGAGHADVVQVRMARRKMRQGSASRGNASMPSRGARGQQYGGTTGGPRH